MSEPSQAAMRAAEKILDCGFPAASRIGATQAIATIIDNENKGLVEAAQQMLHSPGIRSHRKLGAALTDYQQPKRKVSL